MIEIYPITENIQDTQPEKTMCKALFLTDVDISPENLEACHRMRRKGWVIFKIFSRK